MKGKTEMFQGSIQRVESIRDIHGARMLDQKPLGFPSGNITHQSYSLTEITIQQWGNASFSGNWVSKSTSSKAADPLGQLTSGWR